jgi:propanol-preferring alcohol dehydrogenase
MRLTRIGAPLELHDVEIPKVEKREVLVKVEATGVCHSDVHIRKGRYGKFRIVEDLGACLPFTLGHEIAGRVEVAGSEVRGVTAGDRVLVDPWQGEGSCRYCKSGQVQLCDRPVNLGENTDGGYAEFVRVPDESYVFRIHHTSPQEVAPIACGGLTAYKAVLRAELTPSSIIAIVGGGGGLGTMAIQIVEALSNATVIGVDLSHERVQAASNAGAHHVVDASIEPPVEVLRALTNDRGVDAVIDFSSSDQTLSTYSQVLAKGGRYVLVGLYGGNLTVHAPFMVMNELRFLGTTVGTLTDFGNVVHLAEKRVIKPFIAERMPLDRVNEAIDNLELARVVGRQVILP